MLTARARAALGISAFLALNLCAPGTASALERNDTMSDWLQASEVDRSRVLDELRASNPGLKSADRAKVMACMDGAAAVAGHGALSIEDVAEACSDASAPAGTDI